MTYRQDSVPYAMYPKYSGTLSYKVLPENKTEVYDLDFAGYCVMRDVEIVDMIKTRSGGNGRPDQYLFLFHDKGEEIARLSVEYTNSESAKHADCVRRIKKAIRSVRPREG